LNGSQNIGNMILAENESRYYSLFKIIIYFNDGPDLHMSVYHNLFHFQHILAVGNVDSWITHTIKLYNNNITFIYNIIILIYTG